VPYATQPAGYDATAYAANGVGAETPYDYSNAIGGPAYGAATTEGGYTTDTVSSGEPYFSDAEAAFQRGDYRDAVRLTAHALIDMPRDVRAHELMSLALFAQGDYRGAAMEARIAIVLGPVADWSTLYSYYNSLPTYEKQLKALSAYVGKNPNMTDGRFLLAYHNLMMGHTNEAKVLLTQETAKAPKDRVAVELLKQLESGTGQAGSLTAAKAGPSRQ
jgi:Flp pilus assembly protein TadD